MYLPFRVRGTKRSSKLAIEIKGGRRSCCQGSHLGQYLLYSDSVFQCLRADCVQALAFTGPHILPCPLRRDPRYRHLPAVVDNSL